MQKNLVIVESPAKAKTIEKFLGKDYKVLSSYGHIRDLKKKTFSIDVEHNFAPIYEIPADKKKIVDNLQDEASKAASVWLASDEDREGEAIAWHLAEVLHLDPKKTKRIVFHEITQNAILEAIKNPRTIDMNRVDAQQARRILDRIVGFELSPVLWKKVKPALSAGRVQSVAVRLIVEREREIEHFKSDAAFRIVGEFVTEDGIAFTAELNTRPKTIEEATALLETCKTAQYTLQEINMKPAHKSPAPPFTTSTMQQEAARKLGFSVAQTMSVAQRLYENGHITYMRTDSVNLSALCLGTTRDEILASLGEKYLHTRNYHTKTRGAQEAHEAIRPTYISQHEIEGTRQEQRLYELIWKRTIASQMSDAEIEKTTATIAIEGRKEQFVATGEVLKFDGFLRVYLESNDEEGENDTLSHSLPAMKAGSHPTCNTITATERFSQHPPRYTEASLVKKLEELGIGRPSTYAPTISTIQQRGYVEKGDRPGKERSYRILSLKNGSIKETEKKEIAEAEKNKLLPTDTGIVVNDFLTEYFPDILDYNFTASVEERFDHIAEGKTSWPEVIATFYKWFHPAVEKTESMRFEHKVGERILGTDPKTGRTVSVKIGRFGPLVQIGLPTDAEKPLFTSLQKGQSMNSITLEEALKLFDLPRKLGTFEDKEIEANVGRFGPYIRHNGKFVSIPKELTPQTITLEEAIELIEQKRKEDSNRLIRQYDEDADLQVLNGRYGAYIAYKKKNYKIPKGNEAAALSYADCMRIIEEADKNPSTSKTGTRKSTTKKK